MEEIDPQIGAPFPPRVLVRSEPLEPEDHQRGDGVDAGHRDRGVDASPDEEMTAQHRRDEHDRVGGAACDALEHSGHTNPPPVRRRADPLREWRSVWPPSEAAATIS